VLATNTMTASSLSAAALFAGDTEIASDHAPVAADFDFTGTVASVPPAGGPVGFRLLPGYPNPFHEQSTIRYVLEAPGSVDLAVFDAGGRRVQTLFNGPADAGQYTVAWSGRDAFGHAMPAGAYFVRLEVNGRATVVRSILLQ
jgi:hypothetical protein